MAARSPATAPRRVVYERRYRQTVRSIDIWSVLKISLCFYLCALIVVLFDEDQRSGGMQLKDPLGQGGHTICFLLGPGVRPGVYTRTEYAYSVLRTLQDGYGVGPYLGHAADVRPLDQIWR